MNQSISASILTSLVYRPSDDPNDNPDGNLLEYEVSGGGDTVRQTVTIHEVPAGSAPGQESTISSDNSPLTSGNDAYASFVTTPEFVQGVSADISGNTLLLKTDFQNTPINDTFELEDLNSPTVMRGQLQITLTITRNGLDYTFVVVSDERNDFLNNEGTDWAKTTELVNGVPKDLWVNTVEYTDIKLLNSETTLAEWLMDKGVAAGDTWTVRYDDDVGGSDQARYMNVEYYFNDPGDPSISVSGTAGADLIYGTNHDDSLAGGTGDDIIVGRAGNDLLSGGDGAGHLRV